MGGYKRNKGITLIGLIITIILLVILAAVSIKIAYDNKIIDTSVDASLDYAYEQDKERISATFYEAMLANVKKEGEISIDYAKMPEMVVKTLYEGGFECNLVSDGEEEVEYTVRKKGNNTYIFNLKVNKTNGTYVLDLAE